MRSLSKSLLLASVLISSMFVTGLACTAETGSPKADVPTTQEPKQQQTSASEEAEQPAKPQLPDGAELLAAHVEASGGADKIPKFETLHLQGTVAVEEQKLHGTMELWWQKDGKVYLEQNIEGIGKSRVGYDGETVWLEDPITGLRKLDGAEATAYIQSSEMFLGHDWKRHFTAANTLGKQTVGGNEVWEVELVSKTGPNLTVGIDADSKLIRYVKSVQPSMLGDTPVEVRSDRYEVIEGYKFSMHRINAISTLLELDETITKFEVNVPVDASMFAFPSKREVVPSDPSQQAPVQAPI